LYVNPTLTAAADWRSIEWSNNSGWGLYGAGTANNYLGGDTAIGTATLGTATKLTIGGSETASSAIARGGLLNTTLVASANNDVLVGLDVNPTFTNGAFTGVQNYAARITGKLSINGQVDFSNGWQIYTNGFAALNNGGFSNTSIIQSGNFTNSNLTLGTTNSTGKLILQSNASVTAITIFPTSNVLIQNGGTFTDAGFRLDVNGTARVSDTLSVTSNTSTSYALNIIGRTTTGNASTINFFNNAASTRYGFVYVDSSTFEIGSITGSNIPLIFSTNQSERMRITSGGNLLVGSTSDVGQKLYVNGDVKVGTYLFMASEGSGSVLGDISTGNYLRFLVSNGERMRITSGGNLLVGTTTDAGFKLDVNGTARVSGETTITSASTGSAVLNINANGTSGQESTINLRSGFSATTGDSYIKATVAELRLYASSVGGTNSRLTAYTGGSERMRIDSSGNVGIGTTSPAASAILQADSTSKGFLPPRGTNTQMLAIASPATGLMFYDTTNNKLNCYDGTTWQACW
jgi:hypothetical protein